MATDRTFQAGTEPPDRSLTSTFIIRIVLNLAVIAIFTYGAFTALDWQMTARVLPLAACVAGAVTATASLLYDLYRWRRVGSTFVVADRTGSEVDETPEQARRRERDEVIKGLRYVTWIAAMMVLMYLMGPLVAGALFLLVFLKLEGKESWSYTVLAIVGLGLAIAAFEVLLDLRLPDGRFDILPW